MCKFVVMRWICRIGTVWVFLVAVFVVAKLFFIMAYGDDGTINATDWCATIVAGLRLDAAVASYIMAVPTLLAVVQIWSTAKWMDYAVTIWFGIAAFIISAIVVLNILLYPHWRFPIDATPVFYFITSPSASLASGTVWENVVGATAICILAVIVFLVCRWLWRVWGAPSYSRKYQICNSVVAVPVLALLFLSIRGGTSVATLNPGVAYFSNRAELNHAALNPVFNLLYSAMHRHELEKQAHYFEEADAWTIFNSMSRGSFESQNVKLSLETPDIYLIILESFSNHLFPSLGGDSIALGLDSIASQGLVWTDFYANGFRTDRGIPAVLSGLPSPSVTSVMKLPEVTEHLPALPAELRKLGYHTRYYYGGDADFANMRSYLKNAGISELISVEDFPRALISGKWGVDDGPLFERIAGDVFAAPLRHPRKPALTVIQTSSSHEPFEVPVTFARYASMPPAVNAFAYTDSVVTRFINQLHSSALWKEALVILVADHWGAYPESETDMLSRHKIPLIVTGGAVDDMAPAQFGIIGSQTDIAPTLLAWLGISSDFPFGTILSASDAAHKAVMIDSDICSLLTDDAFVTLNVKTGEDVSAVTDSVASDRLKAYLQILSMKLSGK